MMRKYILLLWALVPITTTAQSTGNETIQQQNAAARVVSMVNPLTIGGYAQIDYNQQFSNDYKYNGILEVHRMVLLFGYQYSDRLSFVTEIESEHVNELYIEQAFLDYKIGKILTLRSGLILIPMGLINEYHEPSTYNGVERPFIDNLISPTTWRELGAGFTGNIPRMSAKYQLYITSGFAGYKGSALLDGKNGFRKARQKGILAIASTPDFSGRLDFYGVPKTAIGLSFYTGVTESSLYNGIDKNDDIAMATADSSVVGINMIGADFRFNASGLGLRGQFYYASVNNSLKYNVFTGKDIGSAMSGWYLEAGYNILRPFPEFSSQLIPFVRFENANTHFRTESDLVANPSYRYNVVTAGVSLKPDKDVALKTDIQIIKDGTGKQSNYFNCGVAVWF